MGTPNWVNRTIWTGDNLHILRGMNSDCVDLIYLDPPFNSNRNYAAPIGSKAAGAAFKDTWYLSDLDVAWMGLIADTEPALYQVVHAAGLAHGKGMQSYLCMMAVRLIEMKRILKETGSIYLHCDPTASHYLKTLMDAIFGARRYCNDICWLRNPSHPDSKSFGNVADQILFYGGPINKDSIRIPLSQEAIKAHYRFKDDRGFYRPENLKTTGLQGGGYVYDFYGHTGPWRCPESTMMEWERDERIHIPAKEGGGSPKEALSP